MSSHHVVREKQEPALLVLGLNGFADELLGQLLEWSPTVITTPQTAEVLNAYGIKIDWIIGDKGDEDVQSDIQLLSQGQGSFTDTALTYLVDNNFPSVNVVSNDFDLEAYRYFADKINLVVFNNNKKIYAVSPGFTKWKPAGEIIELLTPAAGLEISGLQSINSTQYKTIADGFFSIAFAGKQLFIAEQL